MATVWKIVVQSIERPTETSSVDAIREVSDKISKLPDQTGYTKRAYTTDAAPKRLPKSKAIVVSPTFKLIFLSVLGITIAAGIAQIIMASFWKVPTPPQQSVFDAMGFAWKAGIGAIFGLLGGKAT